MSIASRIKQTMAECAVNQKQLAEMTGLSRSGISQYLSGKVTPPPQSLDVIAKALEVEFTYLSKIINLAFPFKFPIKLYNILYNAQIQKNCRQHVSAPQ